MVEGLSRRLRAFADKDGRGYPDWASRYVPVVNRFRVWGAFAKPVLEIGANENGLARFSGTRVIAVDIARDHLVASRATQKITPVVADMAALPFRDGAFGGCVCMDSLEHIDERTRSRAIREACRVLADSGVAVIGFPAGQAAARAEEAIRLAYGRYCGQRLRWLEEHVEHGLPDTARVRLEVESAAGRAHGVSVGKNVNVWVWRAMWRILMCGWPGRGNVLFQVLLRLATPLVCRAHVGTCYRTFVWVEPGS